MTKLTTISPINNDIYFQCDHDNETVIDATLLKASSAFDTWSQLSVQERATYISQFIDILIEQKEDISEEITWQMGRPISQTGGEINGLEERARHMIDIAEEALANHSPKEVEGFERYIERVPLGVIAILSPWNYPYLTSINALVPSLMAGNTVVLKHSAQTPLVAKRYLDASLKAGFPEGVFQILYLNHDNTAKFISDERVNGVFFTGSVEGGKAIQQSLTNKFIPCGLELGGKDPAYVRADADVDFSAENLVDGAFFNSGQSCCGIERIYVDESIYDAFVEKFVEHTKQYRLGDPTLSDTNLGPMVKTSAADYIRAQVKDALDKGAKSLIDESHFPASKEGTPYLSPHVLVDVNHDMAVMQEESFGPVVGIMKVSDDEQAISLMNDSDYGLTASLWTRDFDRAKALGKKINTGTLFLNRCDYLDPALAWTGVKNTGRGVTLSALGYDHVTRVKSINFRK